MCIITGYVYVLEVFSVGLWSPILYVHTIINVVMGTIYWLIMNHTWWEILWIERTYILVVDHTHLMANNNMSWN
jgi:hypothetical protein